MRVEAQQTDGDEQDKVECPDCGMRLDPRGLSGHRGGLRCKVRQDQQEAAASDYVEIGVHGNYDILDAARELPVDCIRTYRYTYHPGSKLNPGYTGSKYYLHERVYEYLQQVVYPHNTKQASTVPLDDYEVETWSWVDDDELKYKRKIIVADGIAYDCQGNGLGRVVDSDSDSEE